MASSIINVEEGLRLIPYYPNFEVTLPWYQDPVLCKQMDDRDEVYTLELLEAMYSFLSTHGDCYYIEFEGILAGDITLRDNAEVCIAIAKEFQNKHLGRKCVRAILELAKEKGMTTVEAEIYPFNAQSRKMFLSVGFVQTQEDRYEYKL